MRTASIRRPLHRQVLVHNPVTQASCSPAYGPARTALLESCAASRHTHFRTWAGTRGSPAGADGPLQDPLPGRSNSKSLLLLTSDYCSSDCAQVQIRMTVHALLRSEYYDVSLPIGEGTARLAPGARSSLEPSQVMCSVITCLSAISRCQTASTATQRAHTLHPRGANMAESATRSTPAFLHWHSFKNQRYRKGCAIGCPCPRDLPPFQELSASASESCSAAPTLTEACGNPVPWHCTSSGCLSSA
jgi:hypothetical protein